MRLPNEFISEETCCQCGQKTMDGICYTEHPDKMNCKGKHDE